MASSRPITDDALREAIEAAEEEVGEQRESLRRADERHRGAERELALLVELARLRGLPDYHTTNGDSFERGAEKGGSGSPSLTYGSSRRVGATARDVLVSDVIDVLGEHGEPMPIRALMAEVVSRGASIPGRGEQANLISVITRVPEITRPARGMYGLSEWNLVGNPPSREHLPRRRRRSPSR
jgi:hypothetical protein